MGKFQLPFTNEDGCYEIRLESIGGLGANLCGKMLGELGALYMDFNSASFSSYGSEKRGSPVKAFIRWCVADKGIRINSPVKHPHVLGLFHEALAGKLPVTAGVEEYTKIVINTSKQPEEMRRELKLYAGEIFCVDAQKIAMETKSRINMIMFGAIVRAMGFVPENLAKELIEESVGKKYPQLLESNLKGFQMGYDNVLSHKYMPDGRYVLVPYKETFNEWGYENAPIGGVNPIFGSTVSNDVSASRQGYLPLFIQENCINCGLCDTTCPDMVFQFKEGDYKGKTVMVNCGLDYHHCKGCLRCVAICPANALVAGEEARHPRPKWWVRNKDLIVDHLEFEDVGANGWITSESDENEIRVDGGIV